MIVKCVIAGVKSAVEKKSSLLDEVAEEETELELVLEELGLRRNKRVDSKSNKVRKAQSTRSMAGADEGKKKISGEEVRAKTPGSGSSAQLNLIKRKIAQKFPKRQMLKALSVSGTAGSGEAKKGKRMKVKPLGDSGEKVAEGRSASVDDLKEVEKWARLAILQGEEDTSQMVAHLVKGIWLGIEEEKFKLKKAKSELEKDLARAKTETIKEVRRLKATHTEEVDAIKADTYVEEGEDENAEVVGVMDGLDGVSHQTVLDNQGDDVELLEGGSEKVVREMNLRINDLEFGLASERETFKALLSAQAELQVEEKDYEIKKGLKDPSKAIERAEKLLRQVDPLAAKGKQADTAQYRIQALEQA
ncbi:hypothetical protein GIB67_002896 [Kingdonia uniflora]|uniref:Uncharacterized protein n=1 Tax=Kingdonia uniflora TaxID=39325 RepID=A0A7J7NEQ0_9MAGN|nr:hypothetical protein GIB67_002896 [Kingdonia uniflora]